MFRKDYKKPNFLVPNTFLDFVILNNNEVLVKAVYDFHKLDNFDNKIVLNGDKDIILKNIIINNEIINKNEYLFVESNYGQDIIINKDLKQKENKIEVNVIINPNKNTSLSGLYISDGVFTTQCESHGFRKIIYSFDRPDILSRFTVRTIDCSLNKNENVILSNGNIISDQGLPPVLCSYSGQIDISDANIVVHEDPFPKPSYLFALVVGSLGFIYDTFKTKSNKNVDLYIYTKIKQLNDAKFAMEALKRSMKHDENVYDLEYDLNNFKIVAIDDFNAGAMENKGLNIFNSKYILANPEYTSDSTYAFIDAVIAHEYFHNYTGNRVTLRDWFDLTLKEGLTVFRDQEYSENVDSYFSQRLDQISTITNIQFNEDLGPLSHSIRPDHVESMNNFYSTTVYNKGAEVIRMIKTILGESLFHESIKYYLKKHDGQAVSCEDFIVSIEEYSGYDFQQFRLWYSQNGVPEVFLTRKFNENNELIITLKQNFNKKNIDFKPFFIPFKLNIYDYSGVEIFNDLIILKDEFTTIDTGIISHDSKMPLVSGLVDFSAPVLYYHDMNNDEIYNLLKFEKNLISKLSLFNNFQSSNFVNILNNKNLDIDELNYIIAKNEIDNFVKTNNQEFDYVQSFLFTPNLSELKPNLEVIELEKYFQLCDFYTKQLSEKIGFELLSKAYIKINNFTYDGKNINKQNEFSYKMQKARSLRSTLLKLLGNLNIDYAKSQAYIIEQESTTFSDKINYLSFNLMYNNKNEELKQIINKYNDIFIKDQKSYSTFINMVCSSKMIDINYSIDLFENKISFKNPNLVSSFLGGIIQNRYINSNNGKYIRYIADKVIELDKSNSMLASSIVKKLDYYKMNDEVKKIRKDALEYILKEVNSIEIKEVINQLISI